MLMAMAARSWKGDVLTKQTGKNQLGTFQIRKTLAVEGFSQDKKHMTGRA